MNSVLFSSKSDNWSTPDSLFNTLDKVFHFTLDAAASCDNKKCENYFSKEMDSLKCDWSNNIVWLNPPYGRDIGLWVKKAYDESCKDHTVVVCLLPARTDTSWFHDFCLKGDICFLRGRLKFGGSKNAAPFPSFICVFGLGRL